MAIPYKNPSTRLITFGPHEIGRRRLACYECSAKARKMTLSQFICAASDAAIDLKLPPPLRKGCPKKIKK